MLTRNLSAEMPSRASDRAEDGAAGFSYRLEMRNALLEAGGTGYSLGRDKLDGYLLGSYRIAWEGWSGRRQVIRRYR
jgi:hypothetical protein